MDMLMVFVVDVRVIMLHCLVRMYVLMPLSQVQPNAEGHERCCEYQERTRAFAEHNE